MMSLFNSFDSMISFNTMVMYSMILFLILIKFNKYSMMYIFSNNMTIYLLEFLNTLKPKMLTKMFQMKIMTIFFMILILNFLSVKSFFFPYTSQISLVMFLSMSFWSTFILFSVKNNFKGMLSHYIPEGTPMPLVWFLFIIEIISSLIRPITLTVRLVANITAGHLLMILLSNLIFSVKISFMFYIILNLVEFAVAVIQSYIMMTMITLYYAEVV